MTVATDLDVTGKPAQFGRGVMADVAGKLTDQFAACLADRVSGPAAATAGPGSRTPAEAPAGAPPSEASAGTTAPAGERAAAAHAAAPEAAGALDVVNTVVMPMAKRSAPAMAGMMLGLAPGLVLGRRRQVMIMIAPVPQRGVPGTRARL